MSDPSLQALLANLRPRSQASTSQQDSGAVSRDVSLSLPQAAPATMPSSPPPTFSPALSTSSATPNATAQNLLNLLNFGNNSPGAYGTPSARPSNLSGFPTTSQARQESPFTAADLLKHAAFGGKNDSPSRSRPATTSPAPAPAPVLASSESYPDPEPTNVAFRDASPQPTSTAPVTSGQDSTKSIFTYKNPFEALRASRPRTPKSSQQPSGEAPQPVLPSHEVAVASIETNTGEDKLRGAFAERVKLQPISQSSRQATPAQQIDQVGQTNTADSLKNSESLRDIETTNTALEAVDDRTDHPEPNRSTADRSQDMEPSTPVNGNGVRVVPVITFPVKAFISITLHLDTSAVPLIREDGVMEISRLKKDFDQMDRSLAAASSKFITYALIKSGGLRIIRQEDGKDRHLFKHSHDRIFNIAICTTSLSATTTEHQAVLGTGISGTVYYATISKSNIDYFASNKLEAESLVFPAFPQADENTAGGVLKTRAKRSSRHPEFFAIGRGKAIHIVWPSTVMNSAFDVTSDSRVVNMEKLFQERPLQIMTGKAGKDFTFSEDDSMIVSLDKTGRLRFWDIRKLIDPENARSVHVTPYIIDTPVLTLATASPAERSWPTSVLFLDKARPYLKGGALRYVLVGLRQNHTLQLWDIALGKAVQEIHFPHESETDAICSVAYHPPSGIIAVGHPTRNSVYFIHVSAPRYVLSSSLSQASFVQRVAAKDPDIPKPESTACMSGIREISLEGHGQLRSLELLPVHKPAATVPGNDLSQQDPNDALFELYVAHSVGVTCYSINREDLGWNADSKPIRSIDAEAEKLITTKELKLGSVVEETTLAKSPVPEPSSISKPGKKKQRSKNGKEATGELLNGTPDAAPALSRSVEAPHEPAQADLPPPELPIVKDVKKVKKKKDAVPEATPGQQAESFKQVESSVPAEETRAVPHAVAIPHPVAERVSMSISGDWLDQEMQKLEKAVTTGLKAELDLLRQNVAADRISQDQTASVRQEAVLRVVSTTLSTNVEKTLGSILQTQMQDIVVPTVVDTVSKGISQQISSAVSKTVEKEIRSELPIQLDRTLQSVPMLSKIADGISTKIAGQIEKEITKTIATTVAASMKSIASGTATEIVAAAETRMADQVAHMSRQHAAFSEKIELLNGALQSVTTSLHSMMQAQAAFQAQIMQDLRQNRAQDQSRPSSVHPASSTFSPPPTVREVPAVQPKTVAELEVEEISALMEQRKYEDGSIKWLQSSQPAQLFDDLFVRFTPDYLASDVTPLVAFSIGITVANSLSTNTERRLEWIDAALQTVDFKDREILDLRAHAPSLIGTLISRLQTLYHQRATTNGSEAVVQMIPPLIKKAGDLLTVFEAISHTEGLAGVV